MNEEDDDGPIEIDCRMCSVVELPHECPYAHNEAMSIADEIDLLDALDAVPCGVWSRPLSHPWAVDEFRVGAWTVRVFFDGVDFRSWDYIQDATSPSGVVYTAWPQTDEKALPASIANWHPEFPTVKQSALMRGRRALALLSDLTHRLAKMRG